MIQVQDGHKRIEIVREFSSDYMTMTMNVDGIIVKRFYEQSDNCLLNCLN